MTTQRLRFVLFAEPRTGSASLLECLRLHPALTVLDEPFNHNFVNWRPGNPDYRNGVHDRATLDTTLDALFATCHGFKISGYQLRGDDVGGLPRSVDEDLVAHLFGRPDIRIIFLRRRNLLRQVVSGLIAHQTGLWHAWDATEPVSVHDQDLAPLDVEDVGRRIEGLRRELDSWERQLDAREGDTLHLVYEDFYFAESENRTRQLHAVWRFLHVEPLDATIVDPFVQPAGARLNSTVTYRRIPNVTLLNERFGCDENGWLFEPREIG